MKVAADCTNAVMHDGEDVWNSLRDAVKVLRLRFHRPIAILMRAADREAVKPQYPADHPYRTDGPTESPGTPIVWDEAGNLLPRACIVYLAGGEPKTMPIWQWAQEEYDRVFDGQDVFAVGESEKADRALEGLKRAIEAADKPNWWQDERFSPVMTREGFNQVGRTIMEGPFRPVLPAEAFIPYRGPAHLQNQDSFESPETIARWKKGLEEGV